MSIASWPELRRAVCIAAKAGILLLTSIEVSAQIIIPEIVVTARKREENLQQVPLSITAFTEAVLEQAGIQNLDDLARITPNLTFTQGPVGRRAVPVLRGIGLIDTLGFDNHVGLFIDGVYVSNRSSLNIAMFDLERVEVVRGPQSSLYGRNTFAGAINYITKKPADKFEGKLTATLGQYNDQRIMAALSFPIIEDKLHLRVSASYDHNDGTYKNGILEGGLGGHKYKTVSASFHWIPSEDFEVNLKGYYTDDLIDSAPVTTIPNNAGVLQLPPPYPTLAFYYVGQVTGFGSRNHPGLSEEAFAQDRTLRRSDLTMMYDFKDFTLTSITAYSKLVNTTFEDFDRTQGGENDGQFLQFGYTTVPMLQPAFFPNRPLGQSGPIISLPFPTAPAVTVAPIEVPTFISFTSAPTEYWSQEIRLTSDVSEELRWLTGVYFFRSRDRRGIGGTFDVSAAPPEATFFVTYAGPFFPAFQGPVAPQSLFHRGAVVRRENLTRDNIGARQISIYGQMAYDVTNQLTGTVELRWTHENRFSLALYDFFYGSGVVNVRTDTSFNFWNPRLTLHYQADEDFMIHGSIAKGSRSGGINPGSFLFPGSERFQEFDPESNWTFETGVKSLWSSGRLQLNASAFYIDWTNIQFRTSLAGGDSFFSFTQNLGNITAKGFELELTMRPIDQLSIVLGYGHSNPKFEEGSEDTSSANLCTNMVLFGSDCTIEPSTRDFRGADISNNQLARTSKHTFSTNILYSDSISIDWSWYLRGDLSYRSRQWNDQTNLYWVGNQVRVNGRIGIEKKAVDVNLWVTNLFNNKTPDEASDVTSNFNTLRQVVIIKNTELRKFGISATYRF